MNTDREEFVILMGDALAKYAIPNYQKISSKSELSGIYSRFKRQLISLRSHDNLDEDERITDYLYALSTPIEKEFNNEGWEYQPFSKARLKAIERLALTKVVHDFFERPLMYVSIELLEQLSLDYIYEAFSKLPLGVDETVLITTHSPLDLAENDALLLKNMRYF